MTILKTIFIVLLVYSLFVLLARWLWPKMIRYAARKTEAHFKERFGSFTRYAGEDRQAEGEVIIEGKSATSKKNSEKVGEYIEFEELD